MVNPLCRAQERTSALLGAAAAGPGGTGGVVLTSCRLSAEASALTAAVAVRVFPVGFPIPAGFLVFAAGVFSFSMEERSPASCAETARVTPYSAPTTRI